MTVPTLTLASPPLVPAARWDYGASVPYGAHGIGQDMRATLSPGNDDTIVAVYLSPSPIAAGTLEAHDQPPAGARLVGVVYALAPVLVVSDSETRAGGHILCGRFGGSNPATVSVTGITGNGQGVFRDLVMALTPPSSGVTVPTLTQIGSSAISMPKFNVGDLVWVSWHIQHDYDPGTDVYFHMHWLPDGTNTKPVRWEFTYYHAKGHDQAAFPLGGGGTVVTATQAPPGVAFQHMITETAAITITGLETDSMVLCRIRRVANGGTENTAGIFGFQADLHYQMGVGGTLNRSPGFYTPT